MNTRWIPMICYCLGFLSIPCARGAVSVVAQTESVTSSVTASTSGYFDLFLNSTDSNASLSGWQAALTISPAGSGLSLGTPTPTDATSPTRTTAIPDAMFNTPISNETNTTFRVSATDYIVGGSSMTILSGDGLMRIPFTVLAGTRGTFQINIDVDDTVGTVLSGPGGDGEIPYTAVNGTLTFATPEPSTATAIAVVSGFGLLSRWRRTTNAAKSS